MNTPITVHQFPAAIEMQPSPFGLKLETWLRFHKLPYVVAFSATEMGPKGKVPYATFDQKTIGDSELIIQSLMEKRSLNEGETDDGILIRRLIEDHLYFILVYSRWADPTGWQHFGPLFFASAPRLIRGFISKKVRKAITGVLTAQGIARHSADEIYQMAKADLATLSRKLGDRAYFEGQTPTVTDASAYGLLANIQYSPVRGVLFDHLQNHPNLVAYCERIKREFWPDARRGGGEGEMFEPTSLSVHHLKGDDRRATA